MRYTISLKENRDFRRLYQAGKSAADPFLAVYVRKNRLNVNRLGITVGTKIGCAVVRNRVRRRIREAYRTSEDAYLQGYDIVVVARARAATAEYRQLKEGLYKCLKKLGVVRS
ncbi:MAG: ribonuclease P protein component [Clostridiales bacterium]|jgi:ribonuclease P protein component|nr:ribonuclease P protein component [Clostridiales bacterium]